jgi:hypothetical protein
MASLYADLGKSSDDLIEKVFAGDENKFETEVNAKTVSGTKLQILVSKNKDGSLVSSFKPTYPLTIGGSNAELKVDLSTSNKSKVDASFNVQAVSGLKVKVGTTDSTVNGGFEYTSSNLSTNLKLNYPLSKGFPALDAASVFVHGRFSLGARVDYKLNEGEPNVEAKIQSQCPDTTVVFNVQRNRTDLLFGLSYFHQLSATRSLATKVQFKPGSSSFASNVGITLATANQVDEKTLVKARFNTAKRTIGFGVSKVLNPNLTAEFGTEVDASLAAGSAYHLKLIYNN